MIKKPMLFFLMTILLLNVNKIYGDITLYVQPDTLQCSSTGTLFIWLENPEDELGAIEFDLEFDMDFFTVTTINQTTRSDSMDMLNYADWHFGISIVIASIGHSIKPGTGPVLMITVDVAEEACGSFLWNVWCMNWAPLDPDCTGLETKILVITSDGNDVNGDGCIDVLDVMTTVNLILKIEPVMGDVLRRADCNGDGHIDVLDVVGIVRVILGLGTYEP